MYDKFMCYCETGKEKLEELIAGAEAKFAQPETNVKVSAVLKPQLEAEIKEHKASRAEAEDAIASWPSRRRISTP